MVPPHGEVLEGGGLEHIDGRGLGVHQREGIDILHADAVVEHGEVEADGVALGGELEGLRAGDGLGGDVPAHGRGALGRERDGLAFAAVEGGPGVERLVGGIGEADIEGETVADAQDAGEIGLEHDVQAGLAVAREGAAAAVRSEGEGHELPGGEGVGQGEGEDGLAVLQTLLRGPERGLGEVGAQSRRRGGGDGAGTDGLGAYGRTLLDGRGF